MKSVLAVVCLILSGCAFSHAVDGPVSSFDGGGGGSQMIRCYYLIDSCYEKAQEACGGTYTILNSSTEHVKGLPEPQFNILVQCSSHSSNSGGTPIDTPNGLPSDELQ
jgi:hypothetical protein